MILGGKLISIHLRKYYSRLRIMEIFMWVRIIADMYLL